MPILTHGDDSPPQSDRSRGPTIVVAPLAFKGTLDAATAARAMARGAVLACPQSTVLTMPMADGGDGTIDALALAGFALLPVDVRGPTGLPHEAHVAIRGGTAVVELAQCCGMVHLPDGRPAPLTSSTLGLGDAIRFALDTQPSDLVICLGGSASTDGGLGMLVALGARAIDAHGQEIVPCGGTLNDVVAIDLDGLDPRLKSVRVLAATDVGAPLLGSAGAAAVFAPQKGATPDEVVTLEVALHSWADLLASTTGRDVRDTAGAGAAGGTGAAAIAFLAAEVVSGAELVQHELQVAEAIAAADLVITGEGRLDAQTTMGKGVGTIATLGRAQRIPVLAVCGQVDADAARDTGVSLAFALDGVGAVEQQVERSTREAVMKWLEGQATSKDRFASPKK